MMIESFKHGCSDDGKIMVDADEYNRLQARVKELEAINLGLTKTLVEMEAENLDLEAAHAAALKTYTACSNERERLRAENAELLVDAERYKWLREQCSVTGSLTIAKVGTWDLTPWSGDDPDRHIDAARQQADDEGEA